MPSGDVRPKSALGFDQPGSDRATDALNEIAGSIDAAWNEHRGERPQEPDEHLASEVVADPSRHEWRLAEAALARLRCPSCGEVLARGARGCEPCDLADGCRFAAQERDRPGVPPGNEHAVRVSSAVLLSPRRYPAWAVAANRVLLPLFIAGQMPTRRQQEALLAAQRRGVAVEVAGATTFEELATRALEAIGNRS